MSNSLTGVVRGNTIEAMSGKRRRSSKTPVRTRPLTDLCPRLTDANHAITSPATFRYNRLAWAAGAATKKWGDQTPYYWPKEVERGPQIESLIQLFIRRTSLAATMAKSPRS